MPFKAVSYILMRPKIFKKGTKRGPDFEQKGDPGLKLFNKLKNSLHVEIFQRLNLDAEKIMFVYFGALKGTQMGTVKMVHFWDLSGTFDCYSYSKMLQNLRKRIPALKKRVIVTFSSKYELFEDHFRTFTPDSDQRQGSVQPITKIT